MPDDRQLVSQAGTNQFRRDTSRLSVGKPRTEDLDGQRVDAIEFLVISPRLDVCPCEPCSFRAVVDCTAVPVRMDGVDVPDQAGPCQHGRVAVGERFEGGWRSGVMRRVYRRNLAFLADRWQHLEGAISVGNLRRLAAGRVRAGRCLGGGAFAA